jgi:hypothetical protein
MSTLNMFFFNFTLLPYEILKSQEKILFMYLKNQKNHFAT